MRAVEKRQMDTLRGLLAAIATISLLIGGYVVFSPFIKPIAWSVVIVLTTWPIRNWLIYVCGERVNIVATLMTLAVAIVFAAIFVPLGFGLVSETSAGIDALKQILLDQHAINPPEFLRSIPFVGETLWHRASLLLSSRSQILALLSDYQETFVTIASNFARGIANFVFNLFICLLCAFALYRHGGGFGSQLKAVMQRIGGDRFKRILESVELTVRGAVYGIVMTAVVQGVLAAIGYYVCGTPVPLVLGFATMALALVPFGTPLVYVPAAIGLVMDDAPIAGLALLIWGIAVVSTSDNFLRPIFISKATSAPGILVFFGVLGGLISFGFIGIIVGPAILAILHGVWLELAQEGVAKSVEAT